MQRAEMVRVGAEQLTTAENAVDMALVEATTLVGNLLRMRVEANMSPVYGHKAVRAFSRAIDLLGEVKSVMAEGHQHLDEVKTQMGCRTVAQGTHDKPDDGRTGLRVIEKDEAA